MVSYVLVVKSAFSKLKIRGQPSVGYTTFFREIYRVHPMIAMGIGSGRVQCNSAVPCESNPGAAKRGTESSPRRLFRITGFNIEKSQRTMFLLQTRGKLDG